MSHAAIQQTVNMADNGLLVTISGAALSLLFYENVQSVGDQMGFLLGEVLTYVTKNVTDADRQVESTKIHVDIQGILPCPSTGLMYDSGGKVNIETLEEFLGKKGREVVGWYRFRLNSSLNPTFRDKILHKQFENLFHNSHNEQTFVACMLNYATTNNTATHKFRHVFLRYKNGVYRPVPLRINNLGADASRHDGSDYKPTPIRHNKSSPNHFSKLLETVKINPRMPALNTIVTIQKAAENHLQTLVPKVCESDLEIALLEKKVHKLRQFLRQAREIKVENIQIDESYSPGEPHLTNEMEKIIKDNNKMLAREVSTTSRSGKIYEGDHRKKKPAVAMNVNNACYQSDNKEQVTPMKKSYCDAMKKKSDMTDC